MKQRLERAGQRSISALVDVTNYVMLELGRPLHVYDLDKLHGAIDVRWGRQGEKVLLLNEQEVEVDPSVLCITDDSGVIGLGGIMGGESTKADGATKNMFLESAFFTPEAVAGRARRYDFSSDASHRFERGVDFANNVEGIERATRLILDICGGEPGTTEDLVAGLPERKPVRMRVARAQKVIGMPIPEEEMATAFRSLGLSFRREGDSFVVNPPSFRFDLQIEEDLIEEVARIYGFERIAAHPPRAPAVMLQVPESKRSLHALRERLAAADYREVINFSFVEPAWEAGLRRRGESHPPSQPDREPVLGDAHDAHCLAGGEHQVQPGPPGCPHPRLRGRAGVPARCRGRRRPLVGRRRAPAHAHRRGRVRPGAGRAMGRLARPARRLLRRESRSRGDSSRRSRRASSRRRIPRCTPDARRACCSKAGLPAGWASCTRAGCANTSWRKPAIVFELEAEPLLSAPLPTPKVPSRFPPVVRDISLPIWCGNARPGHFRRRFGRKTPHRAGRPAVQPLPRCGTARGVKKPCFPGSYARY